jgi:hypothetical protein
VWRSGSSMEEEKRAGGPVGQGREGGVLSGSESGWGGQRNGAGGRHVGSHHVGAVEGGEVACGLWWRGCWAGWPGPGP